LAQIGTTGLLGPRQDLGVAQKEVGGRDHVQHLTHGEVHHRLVVRRHTTHARTGVLPPLLRQQKALAERVEGPVLPARVGKAGVLHWRLNARFAVGQLRLRHKAPPLLTALQGPLQELELLGRVV
jgi:hypothetical protein